MATNKKRPNVFPNFPRKKKKSTQENSAQEIENSAQEMENSAQETKEKKKPNFFPNFPKKNSARVKQRKLMEEEEEEVSDVIDGQPDQAEDVVKQVAN